MPKSTKEPQTRYNVGVKEPTRLELTRRVHDISTTERSVFKTCRRRWELEVIENLTPRIPSGMALDFGQGIHEALEHYYLQKASLPEYIRDPAGPATLEVALSRFDKWYDWADERIESDQELVEQAKVELGDELYELADLGEQMLRGYHQYSRLEDDFTILAVEGTLTEDGKRWLAEHAGKREHRAELSALAVDLHQESGRLLCPIVDPERQEPIKGKPVLSAKIDLLVYRHTKGLKGLWVIDHKTHTGQPSDRGLDFDDQATSYCYVVWRWLGIAPRGVMFNYLIKHAPKDPKILKGGKLSTDKRQLTTAKQYRQAMIAQGLMLKSGKVKSEKHREMYEALLSRGWDAFFRRHEVLRNIYELLNFEARLYEEWLDMMDARDGELDTYPNFSRQWCPRCEMAPLCQAMEDGSDADAVRESRYMQAPDRKASRRIEL